MSMARHPRSADHRNVFLRKGSRGGTRRGKHSSGERRYEVRKWGNGFSVADNRPDKPAFPGAKPIVKGVGIMPTEKQAQDKADELEGKETGKHEKD